jgi:hypothetical protein
MLESISRNVVINKNSESSEQRATKTVMFEEVKEEKFLSILLKNSVNGPNASLAKGPRDELLL